MESFKKRFIILIVVSIGIFLSSGLLLIYLIKDIGKTVEKSNNFQQELSHRAAILDRIQILEKESQEADKYSSALAQALPNESEIITLETTLKALSSAHKLNMSFRFGTLNQAQANEPKNYSFNLVLDGKITDILNWLDALQKLPYSFRLSQIEINQSSQTTGNYNVKILGNVYLR